MTEQEATFCRTLLAHAKRIGLVEWDRDFLEGLLERRLNEPLREWQGAQLRVLARATGLLKELKR